jgi:hypothetical protein
LLSPVSPSNTNFIAQIGMLFFVIGMLNKKPTFNADLIKQFPDLNKRTTDLKSCNADPLKPSPDLLKLVTDSKKSSPDP